MAHFLGYLDTPASSGETSQYCAWTYTTSAHTNRLKFNAIITYIHASVLWFPSHFHKLYSESAMLEAFSSQQYLVAVGVRDLARHFAQSVGGGSIIDEKLRPVSLYVILHYRGGK